MTVPIPEYRSKQLRTLTADFGVYALCDLDETPIYVGQSFGGDDAGIRKRVRRHLTSARSDVVANRLIDVWEVAHVWAWPCSDPDETSNIEAWLFNEFERTMPLMNGRVLAKPPQRPDIPARQSVQVLPLLEIERRKEQRVRFPRQLQQLGFLLDYLLEVKDEPHVRRSLAAHFDRLGRYYKAFQSQASLGDDD